GMLYPGAEVLYQKLIECEVIDEYLEEARLISGGFAGAGALHPHVAKKFKEVVGVDLIQGYGLTENSPVVSLGTYVNGEVATGDTIGVPLPGNEWKIFPTFNFNAGPIDPRTQEEAGELCVSSPSMMKEYLNEPERTAATIKEYDGKKWLLTGDIVYTDDLGCMTICDRKKQLIKYKGWSIFPTDVENLIANNENVMEVAVAGLPDVATGEIVKAWVKVKAESNLTPSYLQKWCEENMTHYKVPKEIEILDEIPKDMVGKVQRRQLQEADPRWINANESSK
ncbi:MAG: long-chain fatty acid--CoA ligase, partial [archaeon]|nr:long-chain fatty acid--CoA ligase [archaeon]